ncbi:MAG: hypothetical protein R3284_06590 [Rubricoccaceae bacterium]|nr:hypothetical protein [Rubricoccaceae bacterium]
MTLPRLAPLFALLLFIGCDAIGEPAATITSIDLDIEGHVVEIQDIAGRAYLRVESFPADVDVELWSENRTYVIVVMQQIGEDFEFVARSDGFNSEDLIGSEYVTEGDVNAVLTLQ